MIIYNLRIVPHLDGNPTFIFPVRTFSLADDTVIRIGRTAEYHSLPGSLTFKSKVVSRKHALIWVEKGKVYIRDTQSSSGTFINNKRLSPMNCPSVPFKLEDNDIVQLGVNHHNGSLDIHRCVKMKIEINKDSNPTNYNIQSFRSLRQLISQQQQQQQQQKDNNDIDECCICLYAIAPNQALFISPCTHSFHFKCIHPLLDHHPVFTCPLCRLGFNLEG